MCQSGVTEFWVLLENELKNNQDLMLDVLAPPAEGPTAPHLFSWITRKTSGEKRHFLGCERTMTLCSPVAGNKSVCLTVPGLPFGKNMTPQCRAGTREQPGRCWGGGTETWGGLAVRAPPSPAGTLCIFPWKRDMPYGCYIPRFWIPGLHSQGSVGRNK